MGVMKETYRVGGFMVPNLVVVSMKILSLGPQKNAIFTRWIQSVGYLYIYRIREKIYGDLLHCLLETRQELEIRDDLVGLQGPGLHVKFGLIKIPSGELT